MSRCDREGGGRLLLGIGGGTSCVTPITVIFAYLPSLQLSFAVEWLLEYDGAESCSLIRSQESWRVEGWQKVRE